MNFTPEKLKTARDSGYTDDEIWNFLGKDDQRFNLAKENGYTLDDTITTFSKVSPPEPERREGGGVVGGAADIGIQFMKGLGTGTRMISDVFGANNPVSKSIAGYEDYFDSLLSAESKQDSQEISRILKEAEGKGILPQIMAGLEAFTVAPAEMTASTMGMMLPNLAGGVYAKAAQLTKAGVIGLQMGIGAAQGAGSIKGQIYTAVQEELRQQGLPEDKIDDIATEAQAYNGKNLDQILIGAGLGAAASSTGAEKIMTRLITGAGKEASEDIIKAVIKGGFSEAPIEALQGGQEKIAENVALQRIGVDVPTMQGVIPAATMEATAGLLIGGGFGGVEAVTSPEQKEEKKIDKQSNQVANELLAENTPATQSVVKELARRENAVANLQEAYDALEPTSQEAQKLKLELSEAQRNLSAFKGVANKAGLSETITEAEKQQIELAKAITEPAPKPLPTDVLPTETPGATYGREEQVYDVFGGITRKPVSIPKPAELPAAPTIEEQTAEKTYGGEIGVFDVFAGARRKPVVTEEPPVSMVGKQVIPGVTPVPVVAAQPKATKEAITAATNAANQIEEENKALEKLTKFNPPSAPTLQDARSLPDAVAKKGRTLSISGGKQEKNILDPKESKKRFDDIGYERQALELPEDMNDRVSGRYGSAIANIKSLYSFDWLGAHFHGGVAVNPEVKGTQRGRVVAHELGHASHSLLGDQINKDQNVLNELQAIEELLYPGLRAKVSAASNPDASFFNYLLSPNELIAEFNVERISNPERAAQVAPALSALLESAEKMKGLVADRKTFPTIMGVISESKERLKVKDLESRRIKETTKDVLKNRLSNTARFVINRAKQGELDWVKIGLRNLKREKATKEFVKRTAELTGNQKLIDYVEKLYPAPTEPTIKESLPVAPEAPAITPVPVAETPAVTPAAEPAGKPKLGEKGGVLIPSREDFIQAGRNIYEAGMEFGTWAKQMIQQFGDVVREFLGDVWQAVSGMPAKLNEVMGYLPKKGEAGVVNIGGGKKQPAKKPAEPTPEQPSPTPEKPTEPVTEVPSGERKEIMGKKIGELKDTPKNIIAKTKALLRERVFDPTQVTEQNTIEAFRALGKLTGNKQERRDFADELNDIATIVEDTGAAAEVSMGAALFVNDLFEYAVRLAAEGQKMMLGIMMTNINRLPTGTEGRSDAGRALRAAREMKDTFLTMAQAEQDAFINYAAEFVYGPNPTKQQVDSIKIGYDAVEKVEEPTAEELTDELDEVGKKTGTDLVAKIENEIAQATSTDKDPIVVAMLALQKLGGGTIETKYLPYSKRASSRFEGVKKILKGGLSNYRQKMVEGAATGLETGFWKTLSNEENKPGSLGELDAAQNRELGSIVKSMLISLGLKGEPPNTKMSIYEQVASILGERPLSTDKIKLADENIRAEIKRKREKELDATEDSDKQDAINVKYDGIESAWDKAMAQQLDMPISESTMRRLIFNELKEENTSIAKLTKLMNEEPAIATSRQDRLVSAIIEKIAGVTFEGQNPADYSTLKEYLSNQLDGLIQERQIKEAAAKAKAKIAKEAKSSVELQAEKAENEAQKQIDEFAKIQSDTISWFVEAKPAKQKVESVLKTIRKAIRDALKLDAGEANDFIQNWKPAFIEKLVKLGVKDSSASILASVVGRQIEVNSMSRKIELQQNEVDSQMQKIQNQAKTEISKLAKIQSDTPSFEVKLPSEAQMNPVREAVKNALKLNLNKMFDPKQSGEIISNFKKSFVKELKGLGVEETAADILADVVGRQIEINSLNNQLKSIDRAIEKGSISEIVKAIKDTPLEEQQKPNWRYEVMRDYLRRAGLSVAQTERIAKLMDISLQKRFTQAKEQAFIDAISKTAPWKAGNVRSKRAFQQVIQAIRSGALDPSRNMASDIAALNGWTGFSADQYKNLLKNDAILADPKSGELQKAEAYKAIQDIISKSKLPIRARDVIGQYYDAQALSGIPTLTVNSFSPIAFAMRNAIVEAGSGAIKGDAKAIGRAATAFVDSIKSWANTVAFSFKNNVTVYSNVDYIVNDDNLLRLYRKGVDQFTKSKNAKERADGVKNMMVGMMDYVRRILNALDYGAIASLQNQNISKYAMAVMKNKGMNNKQANEVFAAMMKAKNDFYLQQIAIGTDKNKASILADEFYISSWKEALEKEGVTEEKIKSAMDAAINDALSSVGRNRQSLDAFKEEATNLKDAGLASSPALWLLESVANAANRSDSQFIKVFSRIIYGFAIVPARVIRETAWFSPYGFVRIMVDAALKNRNIESRYAQSLGSDFQRQQRLNEAIAGTVALFGLMALRAGSTDDPEDEDEFKIVFTGNGPQRKDDPQFYDSWYKAGNKPNSMILSFGKTKFTLNMMRGFEAFTWPAMMLGALDDLEIRKKQKQQTKTPGQLEDAAIVAGFVFDAALRRGPYAFTTKSLFGTYGDIGVEGVAKGLTFPAKTLIPVLGTSLASNLSNFLNDPIDRRTLDGAVWSNIPFIGPAVAPKSLNAFGEPSLSTDLASKMFKLGVPIVYDIPTDRESIKLHELVLKQGGGPSIPTRNQLAQRLDRQPTNKEYEMFVREYGTILTTSMKKNYDKLFNAKPEFYSKAVERIGNRARDVAENKVRQAAKKP